jgi:hypothetical protein
MPRGSSPGERRGGRAKGTPNKITSEMRAIFKQEFEGLAPQVRKWIEKEAKEHSGEAASLTLRFAEFFMPKLQRLTIDITKIPIEEIAAEVARREAADDLT